MKEFDFWVNLISNLLTIAASSVALIIYFFNRDKISSAINFLLSYSNQIALSDLRQKIERMNDYNVGDQAGKIEILNLLHEIDGHINGNLQLKEKLIDQQSKLNRFTSNPRLLNEQLKRSLVSELKESLRSIDLSNYSEVLK